MKRIFKYFVKQSLDISLEKNIRYFIRKIISHFIRKINRYFISHQIRGEKFLPLNATQSGKIILVNNKAALRTIGDGR